MGVLGFRLPSTAACSSWAPGARWQEGLLKTMTNAYKRRGEEEGRSLTKVILCLAALVLLAGPAKADKSKQLWVSGTVRRVEPNLITIIGPKGQDYTVVPVEDFTSRVAVGSQVTAWYTPENGVNKLDFLQYALENFFVSPEVIRQTIRKAIILPHPQVPDSMGIIDEIGRYLATNLGWYIAPSFLAEGLWKRSRQPSTLDAFDPATGQFDMSRYLKGQDALMADLASKARVDATLDITVEEVEAPCDQKKAEWDEVVEVIATKAARAMTILSKVHEEGTVPAATVVMKLYDKQGRIVWTRRRGFAVLAVQTGIGGKFRDRPLTEVYQNLVGVQAWLSQTFARLVGQ